MGGAGPLDLIRPLLDHLAGGVREDGRWRDWQIARLTGGWNNLLYRATGPGGDMVLKFTIRDERDRAGREYGALLALREAGLDVAPAPILLERDAYAQPVVVQTWVDGRVDAGPPAGEDGWRRLVEHLCLVHTVTPDTSRVRLPPAVAGAGGVRAAVERTRREVARLPPGERSDRLTALARRLEDEETPDWPEPPLALCRIDNNTLNFCRRPTGWASVDWEGSGWADPAYDVAELMAHAAYVGVPRSRWEWVVDRTCGLAGGDAGTAGRIWTYYRLLLVWWAARLARFLYEASRGLDERLVERPAGWRAEAMANHAHYLRLAETMVGGGGL